MESSDSAISSESDLESEEEDHHVKLRRSIDLSVR